MAEIIVDQTDLNLTITPNTTQLNVFTGGYACAQGNTTEFQYNNGGVLAGANGLTYNSGTQTTTAANLAVTNDANLGAVGNVTITGGNINQFLQTDGAGGLSFADVANANYANFAGTVLTNAQPNITSVGNLSNLTVTGNVTANFYLGNGSQLTGIAPGDSISNGTSNVRVESANGNVSIGVNGNANILVATANGIVVSRANLGNVSNLTITGGINGYVLQTDGTGNLSWTAGGSPTGNGVPGGANTQIQFNDGGAFGGKAGFTFNRVTDVLNAPGNLVVAGLLFGDGGLLSNVPGGAFISNGNSNIRIATSNGNITMSAVGNANIVTVTGTGANIAGTLDITSNLTINGNTISNGAIFANSGQVRAQFVAANTANITGNLVAGNANLGNAARANFFIGDGSLLTGLPDNTSIANGNANVRTFANANVAISAAGNANILVVTGTGVNVAGTLNATGVVTGNGSGLTDVAAVTAGTVTNPSQPNITSVGLLTSLSVNGNITAANITANTGVFAGNGAGLTNIPSGNISGQVANALVAGTVYTNAQPNITSVGTLSSLAVTGNVTAGNVYANSGTIGATTVSASANVQGLRLISNVATGLSPLIVTSTTVVSNLRAATSNVANTVNDASQPNITSVGILTTLATSGNANIGGNLSVTGNLTVNGTVFIDSISNGTSNLNIPAANGNVNISVGGSANRLVVTTTGANIAGTLTATGNITGGNLTTAGALSVTGNANVGNIGADIGEFTGNVTAANFIGVLRNGNSFINIAANGNINIGSQTGLTEVIVTPTGVNVAGTMNVSSTLEVLGNANTLNLGTSRILATSNITTPQFISNIATGTAPLVVTSTTKVANLNAETVDGYDTSLTATANTIVVRDANGSITANVITANVNGRANTANTVIDAAQPNITSVGTLTSLTVTGNISSGNANLGNLVTANFIAGTLTTAAQPNITSLGNIGNINVASNINCTTVPANLIINASTSNIMMRPGNITFSANNVSNVVFMSQDGLFANNSQFNTLQLNSTTVKLGSQAGISAVGSRGGEIAIGNNSHFQSGTINDNVIGIGVDTQSGLSANIGAGAIAIGTRAAQSSTQRADSIAIGTETGRAGLGTNSIAIGKQAAWGANATANNTIVINATGANLEGTTANALYIKPVRTVNSTAGLNALYYDSTTGEIVVYVP